MTARPEVVALVADTDFDSYVRFRLGERRARVRRRDGRLLTPAQLQLYASATGEDLGAAAAVLEQRRQQNKKEIRLLEAAIRLRTPGSEYLDEVERAGGRRWHKLLAEESGLLLDEVEEIAPLLFADGPTA